MLKLEKLLNQEKHFLKSINNGYNWKQFIRSIQNIGRCYEVIIPKDRIINIFPENLNYSKAIFLIVAFEKYFYSEAIFQEDAEDALYMTKIDKIIMVLYEFIHPNYEKGVFSYITTTIVTNFKRSLRVMSRNTNLFTDLKLSPSEFLILIETLEIRYSVDIPRERLSSIKEINDLIKIISHFMLVSEYKKLKKKNKTKLTLRKVQII